MIKPALSFILPFCMLLLLCTSCMDGSAAGGTIYYEMACEPETLDPQLVSSESERLLVNNCFEGLLRLDTQNNPAYALASSVEISSDGLTYTFTLREGAGWSNGDPVTADDCVFGLIRALLPETRAPDASLLYAIKNARAVHSGELDAEELGIETISKTRFSIQLEKNDENFLRTLTLPVSMPCNQIFFEQTKGKYGLDTENTLNNGPFYLRNWKKGSSISLWQFGKYSGKDLAKPAAVIISFNTDTPSVITRLNGAQIDAAKIPSTFLNDAEENSLKVVTFETTCWVLSIHPDAEGVGNAAVRQALFEGLDPHCYSETLGEYRKHADSLIPKDLLVHSDVYSKNSDVRYENSYHPGAARENYMAALQELEGNALPATTLIYPDTTDMQMTANLIAQCWQKNLGAYINTLAVDPDLFDQRLQDGYQIALIPLSSPDDTVRNFLAGLAARENEPSVLGYAIPFFDNQFENITAEMSTEETIQAFEKAERALLDYGTLMPLFYDLTCYAYTSSVSGIDFTQNGGTVTFFNALKIPY